jgi:transposase
VEKNKVYPQEIKFEAIRLHLEEGVPCNTIAIKLGISCGKMIRTWLSEYQRGKRDFSGNKCKSHLSYSSELKLQAIKLHLEDGLTYAEVMSKLGIESKSGLREWVYRYHKGEREFLDFRGRNYKDTPRKDQNDTAQRPKTNQQMETKLRRLEMENALLKKAWAELRR